MRPWIIMGSAVGIALLMAIALLMPAGISVYRQIVYGGGTLYVYYGSYPVSRRLSLPTMRTTVEHPGDVNLVSPKKGLHLRNFV